MKFSLHLFISFLLFLAVPSLAQSARERGIEDYRKGEYNSAIEYLRTVTKSNKADAEAWNYLGMAYLKISKFKDSRKAIETAVKLDSVNITFKINLAYSNMLANRLNQAEKEIAKVIAINSKNALAFYVRGTVFLMKSKFDKSISDADEAIRNDPNLGVAYFLKTNSLVYKFGQKMTNGESGTDHIDLLKTSVETLESCLINCSDHLTLIDVQKKLEEMRVFHQTFVKRKERELKSSTAPATSQVDSTVKPLEILTKPRANYTDAARQAGVQGTVTLLVLFSADGRTKMILVTHPLPNGLSEQAVEAAKQITFNPEMKDGKPVSVVKMVQYSFTLY